MAARWPRAATVGPAIRTPDGRAVPLGARPAVAVHRRRARAARLGLAGATPGPPGTGGSGRRRGSAPAGWLSGSCFLVDLEAFHSVGGFDPGYFMYFEDVDLAARLGERGWLHVYAPSAVVEHEGGHATRREPHRMQRVHHTSALRYLVRAIPGPAERARCGPRCGPGWAPGCSSPTSARRVGAGAQPQRTADELPRAPDPTALAPRRRVRRPTCATR